MSRKQPWGRYSMPKSTSTIKQIRWCKVRSIKKTKKTKSCPFFHSWFVSYRGRKKKEKKEKSWRDGRSSRRGACVMLLCDSIWSWVLKSCKLWKWGKVLRVKGLIIMGTAPKTQCDLKAANIFICMFHLLLISIFIVFYQNRFGREWTKWKRKIPEVLKSEACPFSFTELKSRIVPIISGVNRN